MITKPASPILQRSHPLAQGLIAACVPTEQSGTLSYGLAQGEVFTGTLESTYQPHITISGDGPCLRNEAYGYWITAQLSEDITFRPGFSLAIRSFLTGNTLMSVNYRTVQTSRFSFTIASSSTTNNIGFIAEGIAWYSTGIATPYQTWVDHVLTYNSGVVTIYQNGSPIYSTTGISLTGSANPVAALSSWESVNSSGAVILIDYAYWYNRSLSPQEVARLYADPFCMFRPRKRILTVRTASPFTIFPPLISRPRFEPAYYE